MKGLGLADLRGEDPNGRRLQLEKQEQYAQALRQQIMENKQRKEAAASTRGRRAALQRSSSESPGRKHASVEPGLPSDSQMRRSTSCSGVASPNELTGSMSSAELLSQATALRLHSSGHCSDCGDVSGGTGLKAVGLRAMGSTAAPNPCTDSDDAALLKVGSAAAREQADLQHEDLSERAAPGAIILSGTSEERAVEPNSLVQERLQLLEESQKEQWIFIQNALQGQLASACEAAEKAAESAAKRQLEASLGNRLSELQRLCEDALDAASHGTEDMRAELRKALSDQGADFRKVCEETALSDLQRLRSEMQEVATAAAAAACYHALEASHVEEQNRSQASEGDSSALRLLQAAQEEEQRAVGQLLRRVEAAEVALTATRQALSERAAECVRHEERLAAHAAEIRKMRTALSTSDPDSVYAVVQQLKEDVTRQLGKLALRVEVVQRNVGIAAAGTPLRAVMVGASAEQPMPDRELG